MPCDRERCQVRESCQGVWQTLQRVATKREHYQTIEIAVAAMMTVIAEIRAILMIARVITMIAAIVNITTPISMKSSTTYIATITITTTNPLHRRLQPAIEPLRATGVVLPARQAPS